MYQTFPCQCIDFKLNAAEKTKLLAVIQVRIDLFCFSDARLTVFMDDVSSWALLLL